MKLKMVPLVEREIMTWQCSSRSCCCYCRFFADDGNGCEPSDGCPGHGRAGGTGEDDDGDVGERNDVVSMLLVIRLMLTVMVVALFL